jgi:DNA-binding transcriptional LysR family regulator
MVDLKGTDLNLLASLEVLIEEANVTRAAARLNISQPALSAQLARLRSLFHDPLLIPSRSGRGMTRTARALELRAPLQIALKELEQVIKRPSEFEPRTANRTFVIAASDSTTVILGVSLVDRIRKIAGTGLRLAFRTPSPELIADQLERGEVDLLIGSERVIPKGTPSCALFDEHYLMAQRRDHPRGKRPLSLAAYCGLSHILVSTSGGSFHSEIDEQLETIGRRRRVVLSVHQFSVAPLFMRSTDYVATLPSRFIARFAAEFDLFKLPLKVRGYSLSAAWHPRNQHDPGHTWLRSELTEIANSRKPGDLRAGSNLIVS